MEDKNITNLEMPSSLSHELIKGIKFTPREIDILACIGEKRIPKKIASFLFLSPKTVENYIHAIMKKLECSSRENLIDFVEQSEQYLAIKEHYSYLLVRTEFEKALKEISLLIFQTKLSCLLSCREEGSSRGPFVELLQKHLKFIGLEVSIETKIEPSPVSQDVIILQLRQVCPKHDSSYSSMALALMLGDHNSEEIVNKCAGLEVKDIIREENYYFLFFEVLKRLLPQISFEKIFLDFKKKYEAIKESQKGVLSPLLPTHQEQKEVGKEFSWNKFFSLFSISPWQAAGVAFITFLASMGFIIWKFPLILTSNLKSQNQIDNQGKRLSHPIRSDLILPVESALVHRPELLAQINKVFEEGVGFQVIALIGMGGAGKTTLARQYAHQQKVNVIWEINADTHQNLIVSFENLAYALATTTEDKKLLQEVKEIKNTLEQEKKLVNFVKAQLKTFSNWLLIYDNVENFTDIQKYFPQDRETWGAGKAILTTRNSNIQNNKHIHNSIFIEMLTPQQKLELFTKILNKEHNSSITPLQIEENKKFLEEIPSFPLDVSIAAFYIKTNNITLKSYLENLKKQDEIFIDAQKNILKDTGEYIRTRYSIVTLALKNLMHKSIDFEDLLLFISLLDSQNIPSELLTQYKSKSIVESFIYHLKQYSFTSESRTPACGLSCSIHRSTHAIMLPYLIKDLDRKKRQNWIHSNGNAFITYLDKVIINNIKKKSTLLIGKEDLAEMKLLAHHSETLLSHSKLIPISFSADIRAKLGYIFYYMGDYIKAKKFLENSLGELVKTHTEKSEKMANVLIYLGNINMELGHYETARALLNQALTDYKEYFSADHTETASALSFIGATYGHLGDYQKAKALLERSINMYTKNNDPIGYAQALGALGCTYGNLGEYTKATQTLEKSLLRHKKEFAKSPINFAWILIYLGNAYGSLGEYDKAKVLLEESVQIYKDYFSRNHVNIAWAKTFLGNAYMNLGNHEDAKKRLEEALSAYNNIFEEDNIRIAYTLASLGNNYKFLKDFVTSKKLLEKSLRIYIKTYGESHIRTNRVLRDLGQVYLTEGSLEKAEKFLRKSLKVFEQNTHIERYTCFENLAELYLKKALQAKNVGDALQAQNFKNQAIEYLKKSLDIIQTSFPENSPHVIRIRSKLQKLEQS